MWFYILTVEFHFARHQRLLGELVWLMWLPQCRRRHSVASAENEGARTKAACHDLHLISTSVLNIFLPPRSTILSVAAFGCRECEHINRGRTRAPRSRKARSAHDFTVYMHICINIWWNGERNELLEEKAALWTWLAAVICWQNGNWDPYHSFLIITIIMIIVIYHSELWVLCVCLHHCGRAPAARCSIISAFIICTPSMLFHSNERQPVRDAIEMKRKTQAAKSIRRAAHHFFFPRRRQWHIN